jgi:hypothetical protein
MTGGMQNENRGNPMKKNLRRNFVRHRVVAAVALAMPLTLGLVSAPAGAAITYWGWLPTSDDKWVFQWELADWIGKSFRDGNTSDKTVNTSMTLFFTQCYAGDWLPSFNATAFESPPNGAYDRWVYANASAFAGNEPGLETIYGGYHRAAGLAFSPNATGGAVHSAAVLGSKPAENPIFSGDPSRPIGGDKTHVLVFAGQPEGPDWQDVGNLYIRSLLRADTTFTALAGTGVAPPTLPLPASLDLRPAGRDDLKDAISAIGGSLRDSNIDHFSLFVTDHGSLSTVELEPATVLPGVALNLDLPFLQGQVLGADQSEYGLLQFGFYMPPAEVVGLEHLSVLINGFELSLRDPITVLAEAFDPTGGPDPVIQYMFGFQFDLDWLNRDRPNRIGDFSQFVNISFRSGAPEGSFLDLAWVALSPGPVARPGLVAVPVPEPGSLALMLIGIAWLGAASARRSRSRA